ncbi:MAG: respiratory nitrate reductase subunit gamma [Conexivisphaerales archaeon]
MSAEAELFLWIIYPYVALTVFILGIVLRYDRDPWGWTSKSSQILEKRMLMWGSLMFHWAFIFVFIGHIMGLIIPLSFYETLGINFSSYHIIAFYGGALAGVISVTGLIILLVRRLVNRRVKATSGVDDYFTLGLLLFVMVSGLLNTLGFSLFVGEYDYRSTIGVYIRSLLVFRPDVAIIAGAPLSYQLHTLLGLLFFAALPFTRLVHIFSLPLPYLWRSNIVYRSISKKA